MRSGARLRRGLVALLPAFALASALPVAAASAHGRAQHRAARDWDHGYWDGNAVVAGTITTVGTGSFAANAYVVTPGPGNSGTPSTAAATILTGSSTKVIVLGQSGLTAGDEFYAVYRGVPSTTPLATLETDTPSVVYAFAAPTPEVEVKGIVTTAPASGSDSFVATAFVASPSRFHAWPDQGFSGEADGDAWGGGYSYGDDVGGDYGFSTTTSDRTDFTRTAHDLPGSAPFSEGTPNTTITTDSNTKITVDGQQSSVGGLAVGDRFEAVYSGTPDESLAAVTATPAVSIEAWAPPTAETLYAFVGTVTGTNTTSGTVSVNVTGSIPSGLFSGADTFSVGPQTLVLGNSSGSLTGVSTGDIVAGGLIAPSGESAATVESSPLRVLVDFSMSSSSGTMAGSIRRAERRALRLLHRDRARLERHHRRKHG